MKVLTQLLGSKLRLFFFTHRGDLEAIERISHEFVEDQAKESVAYCETRFCPHLFLPDIAHQPDYLTSEVNGTAEGNSGSKSNEQTTSFCSCYQVDRNGARWIHVTV